jgi:hypothetical protein
MNTAKITYWIALAAFVLALNNEYQHGKFPALHRAAEGAGTTFCRIATHAERTLATARLLSGRPALPADDLLAANATEMAQNQAEILRDDAMNEAEVFQEQARDQAERVRHQVRAETEVIRIQKELQRDQLEQLRSQLRSQFHISRAANRRVLVIDPEGCPKKRVRLAIHAGPRSSDDDDGVF